MRFPAALVVLLAGVFLSTGCGNSKKQSFAGLLADCQSEDPGIRWRAAAALSSHNPRAIPAVTDALDSPDARVRWCAAAALARMGTAPQAAQEKLASMMASDDDAAVRQAAQLALHIIAGEGKAKEPAIVSLTPALPDGGVSAGVPPKALLGMLDKFAEQAESTVPSEAAQSATPAVR